jgi:flagellar protein FliS
MEICVAALQERMKMFGTGKNGVHTYAKVSVETDVVGACSHKLIVMLFDGALVALGTGIMKMKSGHIAEKGRALSKAILIIESGLRASLDMNVGGDIAKNLDALYEYMASRLLQANLKNDPAILEEVQRLLSGLRGAWNAIGPSAAVLQPEHQDLQAH